MKSSMPALIIVLLLGANSTITHGQAVSQSNVKKIPLATRSGIIQEQWQKKAEFEIRRRFVQLNIAILSPLTVNVGDRIEIHLFDGEIYTAKLNRVVVDLNNTLSMTGRIDGTEHGYFYLSTKNGISLGTIELIEKQKKFLIAYDRFTGVHHLTEVDLLRIDSLECAPPLTPPDDN